VRKEHRILTEELEAALAAAQKAGTVLRDGFGARHRVRFKGKVDIVTETDERAEKVIREALLGAYPSYGMLAEEDGETSGEDGARWIVDPLDGTMNYAYGLPLFAVSIALKKAGEVVVGVVHDPMRQERFVAERGRGARLNDESLGVSETDELVRALVVTGFPYDREEVPPALDLFGRLSMRTQSMRRLGSAALDLCYVAAGRLDAYYERGGYAWDVTAGSLIPEEAGGTITDYKGRSLETEGKEVVASNGPLHPALVKFTREYTD
jgi:myo-inositol-1(or 4)-monophosphatase